MRDMTHMPADHPKLPSAKTGILIANLGTPDGTDYWSMRRYLNEFLSDRRVIDYPAWKWQPILQGPILTIRPFRSGANYRKVWNTERDEGPRLTITRANNGFSSSVNQRANASRRPVDGRAVSSTGNRACCPGRAVTDNDAGKIVCFGCRKSPR